MHAPMLIAQLRGTPLPEQITTGTNDGRRILFIGGSYREFTLMCYNRKVDRNRQIYAQERHDILGYCLCEECVELVIGETALVDPEAMETIQMYMAMGHRGG